VCYDINTDTEKERKTMNENRYLFDIILQADQVLPKIEYQMEEVKARIDALLATGKHQTIGRFGYEKSDWVLDLEAELRELRIDHDGWTSAAAGARLTLIEKMKAAREAAAV